MTRSAQSVFAAELSQQRRQGSHLLVAGGDGSHCRWSAPENALPFGRAEPRKVAAGEMLTVVLDGPAPAQAAPQAMAFTHVGGGADADVHVSTTAWPASSVSGLQQSGPRGSSRYHRNGYRRRCQAAGGHSEA